MLLPVEERHTRTIVLLVSAAGGVSGIGSGAHPSPDADALCTFALRKILDPSNDLVVVAHAVDLGLGGSGRGAVEIPTSPPPAWFPPVLTAALPSFRHTPVTVRLEVGAAAEDPHTVQDAVVRFILSLIHI